MLHRAHKHTHGCVKCVTPLRPWEQSGNTGEEVEEKRCVVVVLWTVIMLRVQAQKCPTRVLMGKTFRCYDGGANMPQTLCV